MRALVAAPNNPHKAELRDVPDPRPAPNEALVEVRAVSLNRGEVRRMLAAADGWHPGWDVAGVVLEPAADGSGPNAGARVVGLVPAGGWAERAAVRTRLLAELPEAVSFTQAATLPVAGLTAFRTLGVGGSLLGKRVLVTGAAGGVGHFAVQLAALGGARVTAVVGRPERGEGLERLGARELVLSVEREGPPFDLILESTGGESLAAALSRIVPQGTIVTFGNSSQQPTTFDASSFYFKAGAVLYAFVLFPELERRPSGARDLGYLASLMAVGKLAAEVSLETSWREAGRAITALIGRQVTGKAVLRVD